MGEWEMWEFSTLNVEDTEDMTCHALFDIDVGVRILFF